MVRRKGFDFLELAVLLRFHDGYTPFCFIFCFLPDLGSGLLLGRLCMFLSSFVSFFLGVGIGKLKIGVYEGSEVHRWLLIFLVRRERSAFLFV